MTTRRVVLVLIALAIGSSVHGWEEGTKVVRDHDITLDDYFTQSYVSASVISPSGRYVAYTEVRWEEEQDGRNTDLWVVATSTKVLTRLTFNAASDSAPSWSADERWLYFTTKRSRDDGDTAPYNGKKQLWRVSPEGGEVFPVTRLKDGLSQYQLSHDGRAVYYTVGIKHHDEGRWHKLRKSHDKLEYGHGVVKYSQLWKLDLETWRAEKLVDEKRVIGAFRVSDDQRRIAMVTTPTAELITNEGWSQIDIYDTQNRVISVVPDHLFRDEAPSPYGWIVTPAWTSNGDAFAFRVDFDGYPGMVLIARFADNGDISVVNVERPNEVSVEGAMMWIPLTDDLCFLAEDHGRKHLYRLHNAAVGTPRGFSVLTPGDVVVDQVSFTDNGELMTILKKDARHPADLWLMRTTGKAAGEQLTKLNPQIDSWKLPQISIVKWTSPDGTAVEGILELPPDYKPEDGPLPLMVQIHGGPTSSTKIGFQYWIYGRAIFAARGWALFSPNYRGSTGYGDEFLRQLIGNKNNLDVADILSGVDQLVDDGIADEDRLAVMGWSNGGYLTNCLITTTDRFKAASSGAGVFDTVMQWAIEDTPGHVVNYSQGLPWTNPAQMHDSSPLYSVDTVTTPTIVHVGENDPRVPVEHSRALHRSLHHYLNVPCELVVYPGEGHGLSKYSHRKAKLEWDLNWMGYHVLGEEVGAGSSDSEDR